MQEAVPVGEGSMAALRTGDPAQVEEILGGVEADRGLVVAANFNGPQQIVISGATAAVRRAVERAAERKVRGVELPVSAPFHCELMRPAAERFSEVLGEQRFAEQLGFPVVSNVTAEPVTTGAEAREFLALQVTHPVRWTDCVRRMIGDGVGAFVEVGPAKVLTGLCRKIDRSVPCHVADGDGGPLAVLEALGA